MALREQDQREVWIVGGGNGTKRYLTRQASAALKYTDALFYERELGTSLRDLGVPEETYREVLPDAGGIAERIESLDAEHAAILLTGDPGEHMRIGELVEELRSFRTVIVPGVTNAQLLSARCGIPGADAHRVVDISAPKVFRELLGHRKLYLEEPPDLAGICAYLAARGFGRTEVFAGEMLGKVGEGVIRGKASELMHHHFSEHASAYLIKDDADRVPDVTGAGTDAVLVGSLGIREGDTVYLLGSATYPCALKTAALAGSGKVFAVSGDLAASDGLRRAAKKEGAWNLETVCGTLPVALGHLPYPDAVLIAGEEEKHRDLLQIVKSRNPRVRAVIATEAFETAAEDLAVMGKLDFTCTLSRVRVENASVQDGRHIFPGGPEYLVITGTCTRKS